MKCEKKESKNCVFLKLNECESFPCVHGSCKDGINNYNCNCDSGYTGKDCEVGMCKVFIINIYIYNCRQYCFDLSGFVSAIKLC